MREFLRGCLVWFFGFPLSVVMATVVLTAPIWALAPSPLAASVPMVRGAAPVVAFFSFLPALLTPPSPDLRSYVLAGARTGAWCGAIALSMFIIVGFGIVLRELAELLRGHSVQGAGPVLLQMIAWLSGAIAAFVGAGAAGGFVFGLVAAQPMPEAEH